MDETQVAAQASGKRDASDHVNAETVNETGRFNDRVFGKIGNDALIFDVEMAAVNPPGLQRLQDVACMLVRARRRIEGLRRLFKEHRILGLEPVSVLGGVAQVAAGLAVDPVGHVDPFGDLVRSLAVPRQVFR